MKTLNSYIDNIYIIHLDKRVDREEGYFDNKGEFCKGYKEQLDDLNTKYEVFTAIDGSQLDIKIDNPKEIRWNKGSYALCLTTIKILEDAIEKGYENILILEDDVCFHPIFDINIEEYMERVPKKWDILFLGYTSTGFESPFNSHWKLLNSAFSCHAYCLNKHIIPLYKKLLERLDNPIDLYTNKIIASRGCSFGAFTLNNKKLIGQYDGISNIETDNPEGSYYEVGFTR